MSKTIISLSLMLVAASAVAEDAKPALRPAPPARFEVDVVQLPADLASPAYQEALERIAANAAGGYATISATASDKGVVIVQQRVAITAPGEKADDIAARIAMPHDLAKERADAVRRDLLDEIAHERPHGPAATIAPPHGSADDRGSLQPKGAP